jgi:hypothetical protein
VRPQHDPRLAPALLCLDTRGGRAEEASVMWRNWVLGGGVASFVIASIAILPGCTVATNEDPQPSERTGTNAEAIIYDPGCDSSVECCFVGQTSLTSSACGIALQKLGCKGGASDELPQAVGRALNQATNTTSWLFGVYCPVPGNRDYLGDPSNLGNPGGACYQKLLHQPISSNDPCFIDQPPNTSQWEYDPTCPSVCVSLTGAR